MADLYIQKCAGLVSSLEKRTGRRMTAFVKAFGCQMNARDSEKISGILSACGYAIIDDESADVVIYDTCTVREHADTHVYGRLGRLAAMKRQNPYKIIGICGCMPQVPSIYEKLKKSYGFVDIIYGTHNIHRTAEFLYRRLLDGTPVADIQESGDVVAENVPEIRKYPFKSGVNIMYGCDNFCTYCIVPYVRGREKSRRPENIIREIETLASDGVVEVMLLGQNVNSYGKGLEGDVSFAGLLADIAKIGGIKRIRFMTSHPKDFSDELIDVMASSDKICRHLHLPLQSGSTAILKKMNRRYTKEDYVSLVRKIKGSIPDIALTTDIIVGFPTETENDFEQTLDVVESSGFYGAFTFIYSKRTGTPAASFEGQVPRDVAQGRLDRLISKVRETSSALIAAKVGTVAPVLVEGVCERDASMLSGRLSNNIIVHFPGDRSLVGAICEVRLVEAHGFYYIGNIAMPAAPA